MTKEELMLVLMLVIEAEVKTKKEERGGRSVKIRSRIRNRRGDDEGWWTTFPDDLAAPD
jgi:hypothetical protein